MKKRQRHLKGKGEMDYDYSNDIIFFKIADRDYDASMEADRFTIDIDKQGYVVGVQIFDASTFLGIEKIQLRQIRRWRFSSVVDEGRIEIRVVFETVYRNKPVFHEPIIIEPAPENLPESKVVCTV